MLSPTAHITGALVPHPVLDNMYENVMFPMKTLYCPPVPPSMLMGRHKPPPRPGPKYRNDLSLAGPKEHWAQTQVARMWRGILTRRQLRNERNFFEVRTRRATMIQCWWRRLRAIWLRRSLQKLLDEWVVSRRESMVAERLRGYGTMMTWQRKRFENAVVKVQRVYRWYRSNRVSLFADEGASPVEKLPFPLKRRKKVYFPWRRRGEAKQVALEGVVSTTETQLSPKSRKSLLQVQKHRNYPQPPSVEEAKVINNAMRAREAQLEAILAQPEVLDRMQWKRDGLRENNFDHNAGMIQRFVRYKWDGLEKLTRKITRDYFNAKVTIIQHAFHLMRTRQCIARRLAGLERRALQKNQAYANAKLAAILEDGAWQFKLLDNAARTIQMYWAHYKYKKQQTNPFRELELTELSDAGQATTEKVEKAVVPPPYNLLKEHIARERALREAARSKMEREMEEAQKPARSSRKRYVPAEILIVTSEDINLSADGTKEKESVEM